MHYEHFNCSHPGTQSVSDHGARRAKRLTITWPRISAHVLAESEEDGEPIPKLNAWSTISRGVMEGFRIEEDMANGKDAGW